MFFSILPFNNVSIATLPQNLIHLSTLFLEIKRNLMIPTTLHLLLLRNSLRIDIKYGWRRNKIICLPLMISTFWGWGKSLIASKILATLQRSRPLYRRNRFQGKGGLWCVTTMNKNVLVLFRKVRLALSSHPNRDLWTFFSTRRVVGNCQWNWRDFD